MLKYECRVCHKVIDPPDAWGSGVFQIDATGQWNRGRQYQWVSDHRGLMIMPTDETIGFVCCGSCLGDHVIMMAKEIWPDKGWPMEQVEIDPLCECGDPKSMHSGGWPVGACLNPDPRDTCIEFVEKKDAKDGLTGDRADSDVSEVQAPSELPKSSPNVTREEQEKFYFQFQCYSCGARRKEPPTIICADRLFHQPRCKNCGNTWKEPSGIHCPNQELHTL